MKRSHRIIGCVMQEIQKRRSTADSLEHSEHLGYSLGMETSLCDKIKQISLWSKLSKLCKSSHSSRDHGEKRTHLSTQAQKSRY